MNLDQLQAFMNAIDVTVVNNYFQTYTFGMHPMIDNNLPNALFAGEIDMVEDAKDDFRFFEDRFSHAIDFQVQEF